MIGLKVICQVISEGFQSIRMSFFSSRRDRYGFLAPSSQIRGPVWGTKQNVYIYENCGINADAKFVCSGGKFILKRNCSIGPGFTVITFNHVFNKVGFMPETESWSNLESDDVIVNEGCWIGANVTLCPGTIIGRGSLVAAGSVCVKSKVYPAYSIIGGNPAKFIKFRFDLEDQLKHESLSYTPENRLTYETLKANFLEILGDEQL